MRHVLAGILILAIGAPTASAAPSVGANPVSVSKADPIVEAAKRGRPHAQRHGRGRSTGGIHPLVGSGDY